MDDKCKQVSGMIKLLFVCVCVYDVLIFQWPYFSNSKYFPETKYFNFLIYLDEFTNVMYTNACTEEPIKLK